MALRGIRVLELAGLAPGPFAGLMLKDFGAEVIRVDRLESTAPVQDRLARGKKSVAMDLKNPLAVDAFKKLAEKCDVLIDPFRPGVLEKNGLGPDELLKLNPRLVYARITGYGQTGPMSLMAGHDINYCSMSGMLSTFGRAGKNPHFPGNLAADFAGGSMMAVNGIMMALFERSSSGKGQVVDVSMTEGLSYLGSFFHSARTVGIWNKARGQNLLDGGAPFYDTYETKDKKYMAVGTIEPIFFKRLCEGLEIEPKTFKQMDIMKYDEMRKVFEDKFRSKTRDEWTAIFTELDACVTPVLEIDEAISDAHATARQAFRDTDINGKPTPYPSPAPRLSRTPAEDDSGNINVSLGQNTMEVLKSAGLSQGEIRALLSKGGAEQN